VRNNPKPIKTNPNKDKTLISSSNLKKLIAYAGIAYNKINIDIFPAFLDKFSPEIKRSWQKAINSPESRQAVKDSERVTGVTKPRFEHIAELKTN
jgi:hypothetical protein